jgi:hypothetical protein
MKIANTTAATAYTEMNSQLGWTSATTLQEIVYLGKLESVLKRFSKNDAIYDFGFVSQNGKPAVQSVGDVLEIILMRKGNKIQLFLADASGPSSNKPHQVLTAAMAMAT